MARQSDLRVRLPGEQRQQHQRRHDREILEQQDRKTGAGRGGP